MSAVILILPHHPDHNPLNLDLIGIDENRLHRRVRRLQADLAANLAVELLQGDVRSAQQRDDHLAVVRGLAVFDDDEIAIPNLLVDHGVAAHAQHVGIALTDKIFRDGKGLVRSDGFNGQPGRDVSQQWQLDRAPTRACRDHFNRAAAIPRALDEALFLKIGEVFVHCRERRQAEAAPDFFQTRRVPMLSDELGQVVQDLALAFGQWKHRVLASAGAFAPQAKAIYAKGRRRSITASPRVSAAGRGAPIAPDDALRPNKGGPHAMADRNYYDDRDFYDDRERSRGYDEPRERFDRERERSPESNWSERNRDSSERGPISRGVDEVRSWFGDDDARRRSERDEYRGRLTPRPRGEFEEQGRSGMADRPWGEGGRRDPEWSRGSFDRETSTQ